MPSFNAKLYGPQLPVAGADVEVSFTEHALHIKSLAINIRIEQVSAEVGGFEHHELFLNWQDANGVAYSLKPSTPADTTAFMANAPSLLQQQFSHWHKRRRMIRMVWGSIASLAVTLTISLILLWWYYDETVAWAAKHVPLSTEERLGNSVLEQIEYDGEIIKEGAAVEAVQTIGNRLTVGSGYHYRWFIQKDKSVNAFALPGGIIVVNSGLIQEADTADELAAVLAHEVQHVENRHALQGAIHSLGWATGLMLVLGDVNVATAVIAHQLGNMYFSRDKEDQADQQGFRLLVEKGMTPDGMLVFLKKLEKKSPDDMPEWLSSHPDLAARIQTIEKMLRENPCAHCQPLAMDMETIKQDSLLVASDR